MVEPVDEPVEGDRAARLVRVAVGEAQRHGHFRRGSWPRRTRSTQNPGSASGSKRSERAYRNSTTSPIWRTSASVGPASGIPRKPTIADEATRPRIADEQRRHHELQLVGQVGGQELRVHRAAALDHQSVDAARREVLADGLHVQPRAAVDHRGHRPEPRVGAGHAAAPRNRRACPCRRRRRSSRPDPARPAAVSVTFIGDVGWPRAIRSLPPIARADQQPRVVVADGRRADQDRVAGRPHRIDAVEVGVVGQREPLRGGARRGSRRSRCRS